MLHAAMRGRYKDQETGKSLPKEKSGWQTFSYCYMVTVPKLRYRDAQPKVTIDREGSKAQDLMHSQKPGRARVSWGMASW